MALIQQDRALEFILPESNRNVEVKYARVESNGMPLQMLYYRVVFTRVHRDNMNSYVDMVGHLLYFYW